MAGLNVALPKPETLQPTEQEKQLVQGFEKETQDLQTRTAPIQQERAKLEGEMRGLADTAPKPPQLQPIPEFQPRELDHGEMMTFATVATALAAIAAKGVRGDVTLALNAAGSAIKGFNEGNIQQTRIDIQNFNTKMSSIVKNNNQMIEEYKAALEDRKLTLAQKMNQYSILAHRYQDEIAMSALKKGDLRFELERMDKLRAANWQMEQLWTRMNTTLMAQAIRTDAMVKMAQMRNGGGLSGNLGGQAGGLSPLASDYLSAYVTLNGRMPIGMARMTPAIAEVMNGTAKAAEKAGLSPQDWAAAGPITKEKLMALGQLEKQRNAIQAFEGMLDMNIDILKNLSKKVSRTGSPYVNRPLLWLQQNAAGDPDVAEYLFQVNTVQVEAARVLNNPNMSGQLTDSARQELQGVVSGSFTPEQLDSVLGRAQADARNRSGMLDKQEQKVIAEIRDPMHAVGGTPKPESVQRSTSKSGKPIVSKDGGKTWEYE